LSLLLWTALSCVGLWGIAKNTLLWLSGHINSILVTTDPYSWTALFHQQGLPKVQRSYETFQSAMNGFYSQVQGQTQNTGQRIPGDPLDGPAHPNFLPHHLSSASSYADLQYLFGVQDLKMPPPKVGRNRRRSNQGSEHVKHRRTRSGCYTCRSRRVKVCAYPSILSLSLTRCSAMKITPYVKVGSLTCNLPLLILT
jgi:hypothetical protein